MFAEMERQGIRRLHLMSDRATGLRAIIAVHSLTLGPAIGGCRFVTYPSEADAIEDALRLAQSMSYKAALAELPHGGAKAVVLRPREPFNRQLLMQAFGRCVNSLQGDYITAMDSGTRVSDMDQIRSQTRWVSCTSATGDPSPHTALGIFEAIRRTVQFRLGHPNLKHVHVALQGTGHVGYAVARLLHQAGAQLTVTDIDRDLAQHCASQCSASRVEPEQIYDVPADLFCPCGLGAVLNPNTISRLRCSMIAGSANNQLANESDALLLQQRNILYAPDFLINSGGLIFVSMQYAGHNEAEIRQKILHIGDVLNSLYQQSLTSGLSPHQLALEQARQILRSAERYHSAA